MPTSGQEITETVQADSQIKCFQKLANYSTVSNMWESAKTYYTSAKDKNSIIKMGCETVENNLENTIKWITPRVEPVLQNETVKKNITAIDDFTCKQMVFIEKKVEDTKQTIHSFKEKATVVVGNSVQTIESSIVPVDQYLKDSVLAMPVNVALDVTEKVVERMLPTSPSEEKKSDVPAGPIIRSANISKKLQREAYSKLKNLQLRSSDSLKSMHYVVDLIQYASENLDSGVKKANKVIGESIHKGVEMSNATANYIKEAPTVKKASAKITGLTKEAIDALHVALEALSKQTIATTSVLAATSIVEQTKLLSSNLEHINSQMFTSIASKSSEKLREVSSQISSYLSNNKGSVPVSVLNSAVASISGVLDSLSSLLKTEAPPLVKISEKQEIAEAH